MTLLALKLGLTPAIIALASLVQRKWSGALGGLLIGLPVVSAPISVFLAVSEGPSFAQRAAVGALLGIVAMSGFCAAYSLAARRLGWPGSLAAGLAACLIVTGVSALEPHTVGFASAVAFPALVGLVLVMGRPAGPGGAFDAPWWDVPARMVMAAAIVVAVTGVASAIGPLWSGLLATFPAIGLVMGVASHRRAGAAEAHRILRGNAIGAIGAASFSLAVALLVERTPLPVTYAVAVAAALVVASAGHAVFERVSACA